MHLADHDLNINYHQWFTGQGKEYILICELCATNIKARKLSPPLLHICERCYTELEKEGCWEGIVGRPEVLVRSTPLTLTQQHISFPLTTPFLDLQPINTNAESVWIALTGAGKLVRLNLTTQTITHLMHLPDSQLDRTQQVSLHLAPNADYAAIVNTHGHYGIVVNLNTGAMTMPLERNRYHIEHSCSHSPFLSAMIVCSWFMALNGIAWIFLILARVNFSANDRRRSLSESTQDQSTISTTFMLA